MQASGSIAAPTNPAFDAGWEQTGQAVRLPLVVKQQMVAATALNNSAAITVPITTTQDILCYQFVSDRVFHPVKLDASVTFAMVLRGLESATTANVFLAYSLRAFTADGGTALLTLSSNFAGGGTEFVATAATRIFAATAIAVSQINEPWRLVLEVGGHVTAPTAATTYTYRVGTNAASDFALTSALTTDLNPWAELSANLDSFGLRNLHSVSAGSGISVSERFRM